jgi:peptidyl-prolyl cis-trans isomerase SurA
MRRLISFSAVLLSGMVPVAATAQTPPVKVDTLISVVAVVGDSMITSADVEQAIDLWSSRSNQPRPSPGPDLDRLVNDVLQERINALLIVQAASRDTTIVLADEEIRAAVDRQIESVTQQTGGRAAFDKLLEQSNLTIEAYREILSSQIRQDRLRQRFIQRKFSDQKPPPVSDQEVHEYWDKEVAAGTPPQLPPSITFNQVVLPVTPSDSSLAITRAKADSIWDLIVNGKEDFAQLARRFSEDGSRELGGDLGYFRPGQMVSEFERAAYSLVKPGDVSRPVLTQFGYHIIKLEKIRGPERQARHILLRPKITDADKERAHKLADDVLQRIQNGASMDSLQRQIGDRDEQAHVPLTPRDSMPEAYRQALASAEEGALVGPFELPEAPPSPPKWVIVRVDRIQNARAATVEDYRAVIQQNIAQQKLYDEILAELRRSTYIDIRLPSAVAQK